MTATTVTGIVAAFLGAVSNVFSWALERLKLRNTDAMRKNAAAATESGLKDNAARIVAKRDLNAVRKAVAE